MVGATTSPARPGGEWGISLSARRHPVYGRNVTIETVTNETVCGCGCGAPVGPAPARGGRAPAWATAACRQRAYRRRTTARPADPPSVTGLLTAVRELARVVDGGAVPTAGQMAAVRDGAAALLDRAGALLPTDRHETTDAPHAGPAEPTPRGPATAPTDRHDTTDAPHAGPAEPNPRGPTTAPTDRHETTGADRPASTDRHETTDVVAAVRKDREALAAAVRAVRLAAPGAAPAFVRAEHGEWRITLGGTTLGWLRPTYGARGRSGWEARDVASMASRGRHRSRDGATALLIADLAAVPGITARPGDVNAATVTAWRDAGETWAQIGARVGLSARAASNRWGQPAASRR